MAPVPAPVTYLIPSEDGVEVAAHDFGGPGRPTLFVHGTGLVGRMWEPVFSRLPADRIRAVAVDLRAHGASRTPEDVTFTDHRMVADLSAVARYLGLAGAWVVGHSMGGATSILTEAAAPGTFARLWVYEPIIFPPQHEDGPSPMVEASRRRRASFPSRAAAAERWASRPPLDALHPATMEAYVTAGLLDQADGTVTLACRPEHEARAYEQFLQDGFQRLGHVEAPVLVAYGDLSEDAAGTWAGRIADALPRGEAERWEGHAHFGPFADLDRAAASLERWFL